jgi:O-antigen/teichoic acid export membrane protein
MINIRSAALLSFIFLIITFISQILITRSITNNLGLEVYGVWAIIMSIQSYLFIADSGLSSSVTTYANVFAARNQSHKIRSLLATNIYLLTIIFSVILIVGFFISGLLDSSRFDWTFLIIIATINVYILSISGVFSNLLIAYFQVDVSKLFQIINVMLTTSLVLFFSENNADIEYVISALIISSTIYLFILTFYIVKKYSKITQGGLFFLDMNVLKEVYKFSINTFVIALASRIQFYTDVLIVGLFLGLAQTSVFEINNKLPFYATYLASSFVVLYYPLMTRLYTNKNINSLRNLYFSVQYFSILLGISMSVVLYLYIDEILDYWLESDVHIDDNIFFLMLVSLIFHSILGPVATLCQAIGKNTTLMYAEVLAALVNIILSIYLINLYGLYGVILGTVIAQAAFFLFIYPYMLKSILKIKLSTLFKETISPLLVSILIVLLYFYLGGGFIEGFNGILIILVNAALITILVTVIFLVVDFIFYKINLKECLAIDMVTNTKQYS